jgi:hypothetical protein
MFRLNKKLVIHNSEHTYYLKVVFESYKLMQFRTYSKGMKNREGGGFTGGQRRQLEAVWKREGRGVSGLLPLVILKCRGNGFSSLACQYIFHNGNSSFHFRN